MPVDDTAGRPEPTAPGQPYVFGEPSAPTGPSGYPTTPGPYGAGPEPAAAGPNPYPADGTNPYAPAGTNPYAADGSNPYAAGPVPGPYGAVPGAPVAPERVLPGLALALLAIPVGAGLSAIIWHLGFLASISTFLMAAVAVILYRKGSGGAVRKGIPGIAVIILIGAVASFFAAVATDLSTYWGQQSPEDVQQLGTRGQFVLQNLFYGPVLSGYAKTAGLFALFAVLGGFGAIMRLVRANRAQAL